MIIVLQRSAMPFTINNGSIGKFALRGLLTLFEKKPIDFAWTKDEITQTDEFLFKAIRFGLRAPRTG